MMSQLLESPEVNRIYLLCSNPNLDPLYPGLPIHITHLYDTETVKKIAQESNTDYSLICTQTKALDIGLFALKRMMDIADDSEAGIAYSDFYEVKEGGHQPHPLIDYQSGSLRDDFDFGPLVMYRAEALRLAAGEMTDQYQFAGFYDLRLGISRYYPIIHINEYLYAERDPESCSSSKKLFDYVNPKNRAVQIEMEKVCTKHLKEIGGWLSPSFKPIALDDNSFEVEASVIIPVRNRVRTIGDAIRSVLKQKTNFPFNLIVIDNHSTDGTSEVIDQFVDGEQVIHLHPERYDLGIGGCWNLGLHDPMCGKFAVQLDSDDVYSDENTLQTIVDAFYQQQCPMIVGSYMMTDFDLQMIAPGIIDHREWTPENGRNNALRINGLGAPRAFYTPLLRSLNLPNTSYGEDYAVGLRISRKYQIGRVYEVVYLCRRWEENSDASPDIHKMNGFNTYKDRIRTWELQARIKMNMQ